jgi:uncharacterized protein (TIGR03067 family)
MASCRGVALIGGWVLIILTATVGSDSVRGQSPPPTSEDAQAILGIWEVVALEAGGRPESDKNYRWTTFVFSKEKMVLREGFNPPIEFAYILDPSAMPKTIDLMVRGHTARGIYKLEGDELILCLSMGGPRPTSFTTRGRNDTEMFTLRRSLWERYTEPNLGFVVEAPGKWLVKIDQLELPSGPVPLQLYQTSTPKEHVTFTLAVVTLRTRPGGGKALDTLFDAAQGFLYKQLGEHVQGEETKMKVGGPWPSREVTLRHTEGKEPVVLRARLYLIGERLYILAVHGPEEQARTAALRFWATFRPPPPTGSTKTEPKKEPPPKKP